MAYEIKELTGSLFKNEHKEKDTHPNLQGSALIGGVEYWVSGWTKARDKGDKWISLAFNVKEAKTGGQLKDPQAENKKMMEDDIPW